MASRAKCSLAAGMRIPPCPVCASVISPDFVNVADDSATCPSCSARHSLARLLSAETRFEMGSVSPAQARRTASEAPAGAWQRTEAGHVVLGCSHRSTIGALAILGVALFWNGIVGVFVLFTSTATFRALGWPLPAPLDKVEFSNDGGASPGLLILLLLWLFLAPFIGVGAYFCWGFLHALAGRTEIRIGPSGATLFSGVGRLGRSRRFDPVAVRAVEIVESPSRGDDDGGTRPELVIRCEGAKDLRFGGHLTEARREYLLAALREILLPQSRAPHSS
jgi:hypothetical protein